MACRYRGRAGSLGPERAVPEQVDEYVQACGLEKDKAKILIWMNKLVNDYRNDTFR